MCLDNSIVCAGSGRAKKITDCKIKYILIFSLTVFFDASPGMQVAGSAF